MRLTAGQTQCLGSLSSPAARWLEKLSRAVRAKQPQQRRPRQWRESSLARLSLWADEIKKERSYDFAEPWHYVVVESTAKQYDMARDCPTRDCATEMISEFRRALLRPDAPRGWQGRRPAAAAAAAISESLILVAKAKPSPAAAIAAAAAVLAH